MMRRARRGNETEPSNGARGSPYRHPAPPEPSPRALRGASLDGDVWPLLIVVGLVSLARIYVGVTRHEVFGAEATVAVLLVMALAPLVGGILSALRYRDRSGHP